MILQAVLLTVQYHQETSPPSPATFLLKNQTHKEQKKQQHEDNVEEPSRE